MYLPAWRAALKGYCGDKQSSSLLASLCCIWTLARKMMSFRFPEKIFVL